MTETHTVHDPFLNKTVEISSKLVDRLRGRYAVGPMLPSGEPEFGWRQFDGLPPIQAEAAAEIERLQTTLMEYGGHKTECGLFDGNECNCGYFAILSQ